MTPHPEAQPASRPRVEGDREQQILDAALDVMADVGYDRLTMDSVAAAAKASKATLYRRWSTKSALVIDALTSQKGPVSTPDTGTLRGDLMASFCGHGGLTDHREVAVFASVLTALHRDTEFAEAFRRDFIGPKAAVVTQMFERAQARGEVDDDVDLSILAPALPGIVLHRLFLLGEQPTPELITAVIDQVIMPAATRGRTDVETRHQTTDTETDTP